MMYRPILILSLAALPLAGCAAGPDYSPSTASQLGVPPAYSVAADQQAQADLQRWWTAFDDPMLSGLVEQAATRNLDVAQAVARLRQAREALVVSRASLLPSVSAGGSASRSEPIRGATTTTTLPDGTVTSFTQGGSSSFSLGADASYQLDLFGGVRRGVEASQAQLEASGYSYASVLISTQGEIARNYILARAAQAQLASARESLTIQDDNLEIAGFRVQAGLVSSLDQEQARANRAQTAASIPSIEASYNSAVSRLGVLTGRAPGALKAEMEAVRPIPQGPESIAIGIPADTLRQRPDIRVAERNLATAVAQIGVSEAQLYPQLSLGGSIDAGSGAISSIFDAITGRIFASLAQTIFDAGRGRAQVRSAQAAAEGALYAYKQAVLTGIEDVENAVVALRTAQAREREFLVALDAANNSAILSRSSYRAGLADFLTLSQSEASLISARNGINQARADKASALIQLYLALGGGWDASAVPTPEGVPAPAPVTTTGND
ncbi:efflux transporter outer membrane subunit [Sphingomonas suaedae]|uniref:Efflux transporter outer membrane subunit n=1 Tax=Sphingomonas suaedae TaxID=2599297 RepID=A0A518RFM3_9SPHN|nr:efflux transporter outer membrane subunit [Sphingomonas suaedae]QDX26236.1 efflux transporter outer membrane subunit [Sphingomonas suaedae]